ncbi:hypothetical protein BABA_02172 [Neobacillus bataviensis LMG 21833]|uniref:Uncharacterized protein n=1 Tax=Neobacillus bataviensis LMG 21833 TaxID=1117379 RepID=K6CJF8_9BACI|nr:hypothetical protein [Neobacillus bataviensis]EKN71300.1 hypothetical protein BABA_02172 [Neobacillus bataviensis LMG 21833]
MSKKLNIINKLFNRYEEDEAGYEKALETKQQKLLLLEADYSEKREMVQMMHKDVIKGLVDDDAYKREKAFVEELGGAIQELKKEMQLIQEYKNADALAVVNELDEARKQYSAEQNAEINKIGLNLMEAKFNYIQSMVQAREDYNKLVSPSRKIDRLMIALGIKKNSYQSDSFEALHQYSVVGAGYEVTTVQINEVDSALRYGKLPHQLNKIVQEAREKGVI